MLRFTPLLIIIFIEGYAVLAAELLAIRCLISYVGNGTDIVSIVVAGVLLPLALGYYYGGMKAQQNRSVRKRLVKNFTFALFFIALGLSPVGMDTFFMMLGRTGIDNRLILAPLYILAFIVPPMFLLGQTIPLSARLFRKVAPARIAGATLFWSTLGSFLGSLLTTLVFAAFLGVPFAVLFVCLLLLLATGLLQRKITVRTMGFPVLVMLICLMFNSPYIFRVARIYYQNTYNTARIIPAGSEGAMVLTLNKAPSAGYNPKTDKAFPVIEQAEEILIKPLLDPHKPKRDILVLGAGGFTFGRNDTHNTYTYVDIDPDLKKLAEEHFLGKPLTSNKSFVPDAARAFLLDAARDKKTYDLVYIDVYNGEMWIPEDLITQNFFAQIRKLLKPNGIAAANFVTSPNYADDYSLGLDTTFGSVFPVALRLPLAPVDAWNADPTYRMNMLYIGYKTPSEKAGRVYTDIRNPVMWDKPINRRY